jgi:hypothetical protein
MWLLKNSRFIILILVCDKIIDAVASLNQPVLGWCQRTSAKNKFEKEYSCRRTPIPKYCHSNQCLRLAIEGSYYLDVVGDLRMKARAQNTSSPLGHPIRCFQLQGQTLEPEASNKNKDNQ